MSIPHHTHKDQAADYYHYYYLQELGIEVNAGKVSKLVTTLNDKERVVIHHKNFQQYLSLGLRLKAVHKVATFEQAPWLASYIRKTTDLRRQSKDAFQKAFAKLMINAVFGITHLLLLENKFFFVLFRQDCGGRTAVSQY